MKNNLSPQTKSMCILLGLAVLVSGCSVIDTSYQKAKKEELEIVGPVAEYNAKVQAIQEYLDMIGYNPGAKDGAMTQQTRKAIKEFQKASMLRATGCIDSATWEKLTTQQLSSADITSLQPAAELTEETRGTAPQEQISFQEVKSRLASPEWIKRVQTALRAAGFDPGAIDGAIGPKTKKAIRDFQASKGLVSDGVIGPATWTALSQYFSQEPATPTAE